MEALELFALTLTINMYIPCVTTQHQYISLTMVYFVVDEMVGPILNIDLCRSHHCRYSLTMRKRSVELCIVFV